MPVTLPKFVLAVPLVVLGAVAPGLTRQEPLPRTPNVVGMEQVTFDRDEIAISEGERIDFVNNSNFLHVIGPGDHARVTAEPDVPSFGSDDVRSMPRGDPFTTAPWETAGTYQLTCTLHPDMNLRVVVTS